MDKNIHYLRQRFYLGYFTADISKDNREILLVAVQVL